jgi:signal transduction histidine kinase
MMAIILIVEDRPIDRKLLATILRTRGHEIVEAGDGTEALDTLKQIRPDLVVSDILMPRLDGYEFVRRMREIPELAATPVIFYTATYHEREARALAHRCGATDVLTKPSAPNLILATIDAALASSLHAPTTPIDRPEFDRDHLHLVGSTVAVRTDRLEAEKQRMAAVLEVAAQLAGERDPFTMLDTLCSRTRHLTLAQHAVIGLLGPEGTPRERLYTSGFDDAVETALKPPSADSALLTVVVGARRPVRTRNPGGRPEALGLPVDHPTVSSLLSVPIASRDQVYGWLSLRNKLGLDEFNDVDERVAVSLGVHAGLAYENALVLDGLHHRIAAVERKLHEAPSRVREEERIQLSRTLHDRMGQGLASVKIDIHWLAAQLSSLIEPARTDIVNKVESILRSLDETIESVRTVAMELRPQVLEELGLVATIERQAEDFERRSGIRCRVDSRLSQVDLDPSRVTAIYMIIQEALTNVLQHAHATRATVTVRRSRQSLKVSIADNGRGISERDLASAGSLGLIGMRERALILRGTFEVRRRQPRGTIVTFTVPLADRGPEARAR